MKAKGKRQRVGRIMVGLLLCLFLFCRPAIAAPALELTPLTPDLLQERLNTPVQEGGQETIDLGRLSIDLSAENGEFRDRFYQQLQTRLNRSKTPLGLNLSQSSIQGDFSLQAGGRKVQLLAEIIEGQLTAQEREALQNKLELDSSANWEGQFNSLPYFNLFRGTLNLEETRFQGRVDLSHTLFLSPVKGTGAIFEAESDWSQASFLDRAEFTEVVFSGDAQFERSHFFAPADFQRSQFQGAANFESAIFVDRATFEAAEFVKVANWIGSSWQQEVSFDRGIWRDRALWSQNLFLQPISFTGATFEKSVALRGSRFQGNVDFKAVNLLEQVDLSNARFAGAAFLNVDGLVFDSQAAKLFGDTGSIGKILQVARLQGNETALQNLVRNFRRLEQIPDANQVEYLRSRLRSQQLETNLRLTPFPRWLGLEGLGKLLAWLSLSLVLLLSDYGTNVSLVLAVGLFASAYFGLLLWWVDAPRHRLITPLSPTSVETLGMLGSFGAIALLSTFAIFQTAKQPLLTLACLGVFLLPIPLTLLGRLASQDNQRSTATYFVEDGSKRQLRLLIIRLPILPRFPFYRDRYYPLLSDRRWSWLNYYDLSLNNLLKFGFNDIRLRDEQLPGCIASLVWYEWSLGILYIALFLWTLSRTIPGLNLLIYLS